MKKKTQPKPVSFAYAIQSFIGYLEGTEKSHHTIKNYRLDLKAFERFICSEYKKKPIRLDQVGRKDLNRFQDHLAQLGQKTNTRRRKILTVTQFLNYLAKRKKVSPEIAKKIPTPHKIERIPFTVSTPLLMNAIVKLPEQTLLDLRNKVLLWVLAETGCLVSEAGQLRYENIGEQGKLTLGFPEPRSILLSAPLHERLLRLKRFSESEFPKQKFNNRAIFLGFNKFGPLGEAISPRGIELMVKFYGPKLGFPELTPRTFRHSVILHWFEKGLSQQEIQTRLGLKTTYAFRSYEPLLKSKSNPQVTA
ncbi:MAG: tyrosine-type recombinase/integrase [Bdellovibrionia bacterium]